MGADERQTWFVRVSISLMYQLGEAIALLLPLHSSFTPTLVYLVAPVVIACHRRPGCCHLRTLDGHACSHGSLWWIGASLQSQ